MIFLSEPYIVSDQAEDNLFAGPVEGTKAVQTHLRRTSWVKKPLHLSPISVLHWWLWNVRQRPLFTQITCTMRMVWTLMPLSMPIPSFGIKKIPSASLCFQVRSPTPLVLYRLLSPATYNWSNKAFPFKCLATTDFQSKHIQGQLDPPVGNVTPQNYNLAWRPSLGLADHRPA